MSLARRRWARRALTWIATLVVALAGLIAIVLFFNSRDSSTFKPASGPGRRIADQGDRHLPAGHAPVRYAHDPPVSGPHAVVPVRRDAQALTDDQLLTALERGNVVLTYATARPPLALRALQQAATGRFDPALARAGEAVLLVRRPRDAGIGALAWDRVLRVSSPRDEQLSAFVDAWLGKGAPGR